MIYNGIDFHVTPHSQDRLAYLRALGAQVDEESVVVGIAARLNPVKDIATLLRGFAKGYVNCGEVVHFEEGLDSVLVRELADTIADNCGGTAAVFSGSDEAGYAFCLVTRQGDLRELGKAMTKALNGRGGGKPNFQQGRVMATKAEIEAFFRK